MKVSGRSFDNKRRTLDLLVGDIQETGVGLWRSSSSCATYGIPERCRSTKTRPKTPINPMPDTWKLEYCYEISILPAEFSWWHDAIVHEH